MDLSNYLAAVFGVSTVVVTLALLIKEKHIKRIFSKIENEENLFMWGLVTFVIGVAMVLAHNVWVQNWQIIVTIIGWLALVKGLALLFLPEKVKIWAKKIENEKWLPIALVVLVFVGLIITYFGFTG